MTITISYAPEGQGSTSGTGSNSYGLLTRFHIQVYYPEHREGYYRWDKGKWVPE